MIHLFQHCIRVKVGVMRNLVNLVYVYIWQSSGSTAEPRLTAQKWQFSQNIQSGIKPNIPVLPVTRGLWIGFTVSTICFLRHAIQIRKEFPKKVLWWRTGDGGSGGCVCWGGLVETRDAAWTAHKSGEVKRHSYGLRLTATCWWQESL